MDLLLHYFRNSALVGMHDNSNNNVNDLITPLYLHSVPEHRANYVKNCAVPSRRVLGRFPL
jgi:hypothetical protein